MNHHRLLAGAVLLVLLIATAVPCTSRGQDHSGVQSLTHMLLPTTEIQMGEATEAYVKTMSDDGWWLPWTAGKSFLATCVGSSATGCMKHSQGYAIDFGLPLGEPILASQDGYVLEWRDSYSLCANDPAYAGQYNYIQIWHPGGPGMGYGTGYVHITQGSIPAKFKVGNPGFEDAQLRPVKKGEVIATSNCVGYATGPHLHFELFSIDADGNRTLVPDVVFQDVPEGTVQANRSYTSGNTEQTNPGNVIFTNLRPRAELDHMTMFARRRSTMPFLPQNQFEVFATRYIDDSGQTSFTMEPGVYDFLVKPLGWGSKLQAWRVVDGSHTEVIDMGTWSGYGGDINSDGVKNSIDFSRWLRDYRAGYTEEADQDRSGYLNSLDYSIMIVGYRSGGVDPYFQYVDWPLPAKAKATGGETTADGRLWLSPAYGQYAVGSEFTVAAWLDTEGKNVNEVNAEIHYDPVALEALEVIDGGHFSDPHFAIEPDKATISISGICPDAGTYYNGEGILAQIRFRALAATQDLPVTIEFRGQATVDSNLAQFETSADVLGSTQHAAFTLTGAPERPALTISVPRPDHYIGSNDVPISVIVDDSAGGATIRSVSFWVYHNGVWYPVGADVDSDDGWQSLWNASGVADQEVYFGFVTADYAGRETGFIRPGDTGDILDRTPPVAEVEPKQTTASIIYVNSDIKWSATDNLAGVAYIYREYSDGEDNVWREAPSIIQNPERHIIHFRAVAFDRADNASLVTPGYVIYLPLMNRH